MSLSYLFPDHTARNRHIAIAVEMTAAVIGLALLFWGFAYYQAGTGQPAPVTPHADPLEARRVLLAQPNPSSNLTPDQVANRKNILNQSNPTTVFTASQIQARKAVMESI